jgi:hypothetical protein
VGVFTELCLFYFPKTISTSKTLASGTRESLLYLILPTVINPTYTQYLTEIIPPPIRNTVDVCNQFTILILCYISSRLVTLPKVIDVPTNVSDIFYLNFSSKLISFRFQIFLPFFLKYILAARRILLGLSTLL